MLLVTPDAGLYSFINQGALTVQGIDDVEEMKATDVSQPFRALSRDSYRVTFTLNANPKLSQLSDLFSAKQLSLIILFYR